MTTLPTVRSRCIRTSQTMSIVVDVFVRACQSAYLRMSICFPTYTEQSITHTIDSFTQRMYYLTILVLFVLVMANEEEPTERVAMSSMLGRLPFQQCVTTVQCHQCTHQNEVRCVHEDGGIDRTRLQINRLHLRVRVQPNVAFLPFCHVESTREASSKPVWSYMWKAVHLSDP